MKLRTRRFLFVLFLVFFVVAAPLIVLHTAGYRYSFRAGQIVQTGVLSITSIPRGATVFLDDELQSARTPAVVKNIIPGQHRVRVERTGFTTWEKTLEVQSRSTSFADGITLFALTTPTLSLGLSSDASAEIHQASGSMAHLKRDEEWTEVWVSQGSEERLVSRLPVAPTVPVNIDWSAGGTALSLTVGADPQTRLLVSMFDGASLDLSADYSDATSGWWDPRTDGRYFVRTSAGVWDVAFPSGTNPILYTDLEALTVDNGEYVVLQSIEDRTAVSVQQATSLGSLLTYIPRGDYSFAEAPAWLSLLVESTRGEIILLDRGKSDPIQLQAHAIAWQWDKGQDRLLYTDGLELHLFDRRTQIDETITRVSDPIIDVAWDNNETNVFYTQQTTVYAVELDRRNERNVTTLVTADAIEHIWTSGDSTSLFLLGSIGGTYGVWGKELE